MKDKHLLPEKMKVKTLQLKGALRIVLVVLLMSVVGLSKALAYDFEVNGIYYKITSSTAPRTVEVTYNRYGYASYSGNVVIPASVSYNGYAYSVKSIGAGAFSYSPNLIEVTIPSSITSIGGYPFKECTGLQTVNINSNASFYNTIWYDCTGLTTVNFGEGVLAIQNMAFYNCSTLTNVSIPSTVTSIGNNAFYKCSSLQSVTISDASMLASIGNYAFYNCSSLQSITISDASMLASIGNCAFQNCSSLQSITIPSSVTSIGQLVFQNCTSLTTLNYNAVNGTFSYSSSYYHWLKGCSSLSELNIGYGVQTIPDNAFSSCSGLTTVNIPNTVTSIGANAFSGCTGLTTISIPDSVTSLGSSMFSGCTGLTTVNLPNTITAISSNFFTGCISLTAIDIPTSVISIDSRAFYGTGLTSVFIPSSVESIGMGAFASCPNLMGITVESNNLYYKSIGGVLYDIAGSTLIQFPGGRENVFTIPNGVTTIGDYAFGGCEGMTSIIIPSSATSIGQNAFMNCTGLTSIILPDSLTSIGGGAFTNCSGITTIDLPDALTSIGEAAFHKTGLTSITIKNNVSFIGMMAFYYCTSLTEAYYNVRNCTYYGQEDLFYYCTSLQTITIGEDVESIPAYVFAAFDFELNSMVSMAVVPPTIESQMTLWGINRNIPVYIPAGTLAAYQAAPYWSEFTNFIDDVTPFHISAGVNLSAGGVVTGIGYYSEGDTCTMIATANEDFIFVNWTEDGEVVSTEAEYVFTVSSDRNLKANFLEVGHYTITATANPIGGGMLTGAGNYHDGDMCTLVATANGNYVFVNWTENGEVVSTEAEYSFTVSGDRNLVANFFEIVFYTISATANPIEGGTVAGGGNYQEGSTCTLIATANGYYYFVNWTENGEVVSADAEYSFTVSGDRNLVANFVEPPQYSVVVVASPIEGGTVTGSGVYYEGDTCTLVAISNEHYTFVNWTMNGNVVSTQPQYAFVATQNVEYVAHFEIEIPEGIINGLFTVSANGNVVRFSQGNLQYQASTNTWQFAENQWDFVGEGNASISQYNDGWIDLYGWATSGYNHGAVCYQPWSTNYTPRNYYAYGNYNYNLYNSSGKADWGYNAISNGGNQENSGLRTMTKDEWNYVFNTRHTASGIRYAKAQVNNVNGVILLPDTWDANIYPLNNTNLGASFSDNIISSSQWETLEAAGAVFLPAAGYRVSTILNVIGSAGNYWSSSCGNENGAYYLSFGNSDLNANYNSYRHYGRSVRLVRTAETSSYSINATPNSMESGIVTGTGAYNYGSTCTLTATANEGYYFLNWTENGEVVSADASYSFTVWGTRSLVANFTDVPTYPTGSINGLFSVSNTKQVYFSQGNLQYQIPTHTWQFAEHQYDFIGAENAYISETYDGWIDLFAWGTSGYNHGATCYQPWSTSPTNRDYYAYGSSTYNLFSQTGQADWGYNAITNGGNTTNIWRTLTYLEWYHLFFSRNTASGIRYAKANVNYINGVILLPDNWDANTYSLNNTNQYTTSFSSNVLSASQWAILEAAGAVFLPAAGVRNEHSVSQVHAVGTYYSANYTTSLTINGNKDYAVLYTFFTDDDLSAGASIGSRCDGRSVRLVVDKSSFGVYATPSPANGGTVSGIRTYSVGATCTLTAIANAGYYFVNWTENGTPVSFEPTYSFTVTGDRTLVANFGEGQPDSYIITASANPTDNGSVSGTGTYGYGTPCTLIATANEGYFFANWTENGSLVSNESVYSFFVTGDRSLVANFTAMVEPETPMGAIDGLFSISSSKQVWFSQGNLQYKGSAITPYWKFADNQWDYLGISTGQNSTDQNVDRDLFGWGTSGYNHGAVCYQPWSTSTSFGQYYAYGDVNNDLYKIGSHAADWGYNAISNGGNVIDQWRTLTNAEWDFVFNTRSTLSGIRYAMAQVNDVNGLILLPDNWDANIYSLDSTNINVASYSSNVISASQWSILEDAGAVFLPAAGNRSGYYGISVSAGMDGNYWSSSRNTSNLQQACYVHFESSNLVVNSSVTRSRGCAVRLVRASNNSTFGINAMPNSAEGGTVAGGGTYAMGAYCMLTAMPNPGYLFSNWTENGNVVSTDESYGFTVVGNRTILANFEVVQPTYVVTAVVSPMNGGTVNGAGTYNYGSTCTLTVTANVGYTFVNWTENGTPVSVESNYSFTVTGDKNVVANFTARQGAINGVFSVGEGTQVFFSQGNLQYQASTSTWRFAEHQYDFIGMANRNISSVYNGWIDLFGWGTSGNNHGATCYQPYSTSVSYSHYYAYGSYDYDLDDRTGQADWGCNRISNGGNATNIWRTLSSSEWIYVFTTRNTASGIRYARAKVNGVNGVILLPDDWNTSTYTLYNPNSNSCEFSTNIISATQWATLEAAGAVFLPAAGYRYGPTTINDAGYYGYYWSTECIPLEYETDALDLSITDAGSYHTFPRFYGLSVRLVCSSDNSSFDINAVPNSAEGGTIEGAGLYEENATCTLTATANFGFTFVNWTEDDIVVSTEPTYSFVVTGHRNLVSNFEIITITQTVTLSQGWNWFSTYIEATDPIALLDMLMVILGDNALQIESQNSGVTIYEGGEWFGDLDEVGIYNEQMYLIEVGNNCTIQLEGMPANPANHEITIIPGWNWIGFPCAGEMTIAEAFANFQPEEEDVIESSLEQAIYVDGEWMGLETLTPGQGFMYFSNSTETKILVFPASAK